MSIHVYLYEKFEQGGGVASERARIAASLERLKELYVEGDVSKEEYTARKEALMAEMPQDGPAVPLELTGFAVAQQAVSTAPAAAFRSLVRVLYVSITVTPDGLEYTPREWCADWA